MDFDEGRAFIETSRRYLSRDYLPRIRTALAVLPPEDLWWRPNEASNSAVNLLLHLAGNLRQWICSGVDGQADVRSREEEFAAREGASGAQALELLEEAVRDADAVLARLDPAALGEGRRIQGNEVTVLEAVFHVVEHFSMHTGQLLYLAKLRTGRDLALWRVGPDGSARRAW
jgi:uncharacterized damage-inducible protein DinB